MNLYQRYGGALVHLIALILPIDSGYAARIFALFLLASLQRLVDWAIPIKIGVLLALQPAEVSKIRLKLLQLAALLILKSPAGIPYIQERLQLSVDHYLARQARRRVAKHAFGLGWEHFRSTKQARIVGAFQQVINIPVLLSHALQLWQFGVDLLLTGVYVRTCSDKKTIWAIYLATVLCVVLSIWSLVQYAGLRQANHRAFDKLHQTTLQGIQGIETVILSCGQDHEQFKGDQRLCDYHTTEGNYFRSTFSITAVLGLIGFIPRFVASYSATGQQSLAPNEIVVLLDQLAMIQQRTIAFLNFLRSSVMTLDGFIRTTDFLSIRPAIKESIDAKPLRCNHGIVEFQNVSFRHPGSSKDTVSNVTFTAYPGQTIALVGPSGAGKTTLTHLLGRLYDVTNGAIKIDGQDISTVSLESLRKSVAWIPQKQFMFDASIRHNLTYGLLNISEDRVQKACMDAAIHDKIQLLPEGYYTEISEVEFSPGEQQRFAIARALLHPGRLLVMDEATSNLDVETERTIQERLSSRLEHRTVLIIAHRLSSIVNADLILVVENGTVTESGTHTDLLHRNGRYKELWSSWDGSQSPGR